MNSYPVRSPCCHQALTAIGAPEAVSMNRTSGSRGASGRYTGIVWSIAKLCVPSLFAT